MESYDCGNCPTCSSEGCADLWQPLPDEQDREERRSGEAKQPYGHVYFAQCFHPFSETIRARLRSCAYLNASRSTLSSVRSAQETLRRRSGLLDAHQGGFVNEGDSRAEDHASPHRLTGKQTKRQPQNTEHDCCQNVGQ